MSNGTSNKEHSPEGGREVRVWSLVDDLAHHEGHLMGVHARRRDTHCSLHTETGECDEAATKELRTSQEQSHTLKRCEQTAVT